MRKTIRQVIQEHVSEGEIEKSSRRGFLGNLAKRAAAAPVQQALAQGAASHLAQQALAPQGVHPKLPKSAEFYRKKYGEGPPDSYSLNQDRYQALKAKHGGGAIPWGELQPAYDHTPRYPGLTQHGWWRLRSLGFKEDDSGQAMVRNDHQIFFDGDQWSHLDYSNSWQGDEHKTGKAPDLHHYLMSDEFENHLD